jgi:phosphatidate cytidylyltransferase
MKTELRNRILTSIIITPILFSAIIYSGLYLIILLIISCILSVYEIIKNTKNLLFIFFSVSLLLFSFYSFYFLRGNTDESLIVFIWILSATFFSDIGGYIFGKIFKGKKLTKISPNKTFSGAFGSLILSLVSLPLINFIQIFFFNKLLLNFYELNFLILTIFISLICQGGDLFVSFLKRKAKIKNTSNIFPGHGGILDRIDGLIFVLIFCFILRLFAKI